MSRQFTWWRRFGGTIKLPKKYLYKGASELLQRIEFGEYEFDHLGREIYLEDKIYEAKVEAIKKEKPWLKGETLTEALEYDRKQYNKRKAVMMKKHLENEQVLLWKLAEELSKEFNIPKDDVSELMETFDGTTRELYFKCMSIAIGKDIDPSKMQRFFQEQPQHILKPKERKYIKLWMALVKERNWQRFLNWEQLK
jgi:hypothetical protein